MYYKAKIKHFKKIKTKRFPPPKPTVDKKQS